MKQQYVSPEIDFIGLLAHDILEESDSYIDGGEQDPDNPGLFG